MENNKAKKAGNIQPASLTLAVVGAGMSGLVAARTLADHGLEVRVFDKSRGPGGRMSTRREGEYHFDLGAQYFTIRDDRFQRSVDSWIQEGIVKLWQARIFVAKRGKLTPKQETIDRYVGLPGMSAVAHHLAADLDTSFKVGVKKIARCGDQWQLIDDLENDLGCYDAVIVSTVPEQAAPLLVEARDLARRAQSVRFAPTWAAMVAFVEPLDLPFDGAFVHESSLAWIARNSSKPGRPSSECWVLHGSPEWSTAHLEDDADSVAGKLVTAFFRATGINRIEPIFAKAHRWRYAIADNPLEVGCLWEPDLKLGACGDWCQMSRVEGAFLSGLAMAARILGHPEESLAT